MLKTGIKGHAEAVVDRGLTAKEIGSGELNVYATPALIALAEKAAWQSVAAELEEGMGSVGTRMDLSHLAATPAGMKVWCETQLVEIDRRKLVFAVEAFDETGKIAEGRHERFIVDNVKFQMKADSKKA